MNSQDDRIAKRPAEIRAQEQELDRESPQRQAEVTNPAAVRSEGSAAQSILFLTGVIMLAAALLGCAVTLNRIAGKDIAAAKRLGRATVTACQQHGPVTNQGFGYWDRCTVTIEWANGQANRMTVDAVFTSADVGRTVRVGDLGNYRTSKQLARADSHPSPWLTWVGYALGILALLPVFIAVMFLRELVRSRP